MSDDLIKMAEKELGETDEIRKNTINEMRDWILNNPRIEKCRMDAKYLLKFLRFRKFNVSEAQEAYERCLIFREGAYGFNWFNNMDFTRTGVQQMFNDGLIIVFPNRDIFGRKTILARLSVSDPSVPTVGSDGITLTTMFCELLLEDEENQIRGFNYILDISNIKLRHFFIYSIPTWLKLGKNVEVILISY
jgi:hypothetical protein